MLMKVTKIKDHANLHDAQLFLLFFSRFTADVFPLISRILSVAPPKFEAEKIRLPPDI